MKCNETPGLGWPIKIDPDYEYKDIAAGPTTKFEPSADGKRLKITQGDNTVEIEPEHIKLLQGMADRWIQRYPCVYCEVNPCVCHGGRL